MSEINQYDSLKRMKDLLDAGILTQEEFNKEKAKILGNNEDSNLTDEQKAHLRKLDALKDAGILTVEEYEEQKRAILSHRNTYQENTASFEARQAATVNYRPSPTPKRKNPTLWIILGAVASFVVIVLILGSNSGDYSNEVNGFYSNPYSEIDNYIDGYDRCYRDGNTVYYKDYQDYFPGDELLGNVLQNPDALSIFGETATDIGKMISGSVREEVLSYLIREDYGLIQLIVQSGLTLCYTYAGKNLFFYTPEEIKRRLPSY